MPIIKVRGIYTINVSPNKKECGYCSYCECPDYRAKSPKFRCFLFKSNLRKREPGFIIRCKKCLKSEIR